MSGNHFGGFGDRYLQLRAVEAGQNQATQEKHDLVQGRDRPKFASITWYGNSNSENPVSISRIAHIENGHQSKYFRVSSNLVPIHMSFVPRWV